MIVAEYILFYIAKRWPSPVQQKEQKLGNDSSSEQYGLNYALYSQYLRKVQEGVNFCFYDKDILEVGCGHGGISCFLAVNGARKVVGIDLNTHNLKIADLFKRKFSICLNKNNNGQIPLEFLEMDAAALKFNENSFDVVMADNVFEHFENPEKVLGEIHRILKPEGKLIVPTFSSWWSKYALHLKHGLKVPWANLVFSEKTIIRVLYKLAKERPELFDMYPGLKNKPEKVRDVRKHNDLNYITYKSFKRMAVRQGFVIRSFSVLGSRKLKFLSAIVRRIPILNNTMVLDILSVAAAGILEKKIS